MSPYPSFDGVSALESVVEPFSNQPLHWTYNCHTESAVHHKLQFNWENYFGCEEGQTRFQNICIYDSRSVHEESIYSFFFNFANQF